MKERRHDWDNDIAPKRQCMRCGLLQQPSGKGGRRRGAISLRRDSSRDGVSWYDVAGPCIEATR